MNAVKFILWLFLPVVLMRPLRICGVLLNERVDCGNEKTSAEECLSLGCCWKLAPEGRTGVPWCFKPRQMGHTYFIKSIASKKERKDVHLSHRYPSRDPGAAPNLHLVARLQTDIIHIKISSPIEPQSQIPSFLYSSIQGYPMPHNAWDGDEPQLDIAFKNSPFQFAISRTSSHQPLFDTEARGDTDPFDSLVYKKHYLEIGTGLPIDHHIYGLGERASRFRRRPRRMAFNARDTPAFEDQNTYGSHPFYLEMRADGQAHGVLMLNSHPMEVELTSNSLTYHILGGTIDIYFFAGPTPDMVIEQYTRIIGRPPLIEPKFFGFHQCRYGYTTLNAWREVLASFDEHGLPLDGVWFDIDYMENNDIFTLDPERYPPTECRDFVAEQEAKGRFIVTIVDPGVSIKESLPAYKEGLSSGIFLRSANQEQLYEGSVWPGPVHFIDFLSPNSTVYWTQLIDKFQQQIPFSGLWLDMCEPASFNVGHRGIRPLVPPSHHYNLNYPPYVINNADTDDEIFKKTISMDAIHYDQTRHLAVHNVYGFSESFRTAEALEKLAPGRRHFLLTRSTFPGSGRFTAHWLGDNFSDFNSMRLSIAGVMDFQLFGIPMVGADICGFLGATDAELCARWMSLGAFYPFARNHNAERAEYIPQEPYRWPEVAAVTKKYFGFRYSLIPYWNTLSFEAHQSGRPMIRPMLFDFPLLKELYDVDEQFMVGSAILVAPVLVREAKSIHMMVPSGIWYDALDLDALPMLVEELRRVEVKTDIFTIPVLLRGGYTIMRQTPSLSIKETLKNCYELLVVLDIKAVSEGQVYFDDGLTADVREHFSQVKFRTECNTRFCTIEMYGQFGFHVEPKLRTITVLSASAWEGGLESVIVDGGTWRNASSSIGIHRMQIYGLGVDLNGAHDIMITLSGENNSFLAGNN